MTAGRRKRQATTHTVVRLPERDLAESILHLAAPLFEPLGSALALEDRRQAIAIAIELWNAHVAASKLWGQPKPQALAELRKAMRDEAGGLATFELLSERWRQCFALDPRLVRAWAYGPSENGQARLVCDMNLPAGVEAEVPPPAEKRIAIAGRFLDEVRIRLTATSYRGFPVQSHRALVDADGRVTVHAKMPIALQLFADGSLSRVGGDPVEVAIGGKKLGLMVLTDVRAGGDPGLDDLAVLVFDPGGHRTLGVTILVEDVSG